jgi:hypothetical protein
MKLNAAMEDWFSFLASSTLHIYINIAKNSSVLECFRRDRFNATQALLGAQTIEKLMKHEHS